MPPSTAKKSAFDAVLSAMLSQPVDKGLSPLRSFGQMVDPVSSKTPIQYGPVDYHLVDDGTGYSRDPRGLELNKLLTGGEGAIRAATGLTSRNGAAELRKMRRTFARRYHPDSVPAHYRGDAEAVMKLANSVFDAAFENAV